MPQREFDVLVLYFKRLEKKIDRLLEIAEDAEHSSNDGTNSEQSLPCDAQHSAS